MRISEIFHSIQGEGIHAGLPMTFIRFQFCPFNCSYCDTQHSLSKDGGQEMSVEEVVRQVKHEWICITGGEPLSQPKVLGELVAKLRHSGTAYMIEVETSGLMPLPWAWRANFALDNLGYSWLYDSVDSWVVDIKCPTSGVSDKVHWPNLEELRKFDQVKFVIGNETDLVFAKRIMQYRPYLPNVLIAPVWGSGMEIQAAEFVKRYGGRLSLQLHKILWGEKAGV